MDSELVWLLGTLMLMMSSTVTTVLWRSARKRAVRAESLVNQLLGERERPAPWCNDMRYPDRDMPRAAHPEPRISNSALDAIAIEVERIAEAQRFLTQAMLERVRTEDAVRRVDLSRARTPH